MILMCDLYTLIKGAKTAKTTKKKIYARQKHVISYIKRFLWPVLQACELFVYVSMSRMLEGYRLSNRIEGNTCFTQY